MQFIDAINLLPLKGCHHLIGGGRCIEDIEQAFREATSKLSFPYYTYSLIQNNDEPNSSTDNLNVSHTPIMNHQPDGWLEFYIQEKYYDYDAVLRTLEYMPINDQLNIGTWHDALHLAQQSPIGKGQRERNTYSQQVALVFEKASSYGMNSGVYIIHRNGPVQTMVSLASELTPEELDAKIESTSFWNVLLSLVILTHHSIINTRGCDLCTQNVRLYGVQEVSLTNTQKQILRFYASKGNSSLQEIAVAQGITIDTVKFHLKTIRSRLNKSGVSGYALARFAIDHNLI